MIGEWALFKKVISGLMVTIVFVGMLTLALKIATVNASGTMYIRADGSIDPPTAPTQPDANVNSLGSIDWWPMFHHDLGHTGYSTSTALNTNKTTWNYTTGSSVSSSPAVVDGRVYVGSWDGKIYCLDATSGTCVWSYTTGDRVDSSPAVVDGKVYVGSWDGKVYCLDALTGNFIWSYATGLFVDSSPAVVDGKVYVGSHDEKVYCLDALTGDCIWSYMTGLDVFSSPAVVDGKVYVASGDYIIYCLNASTGAYIWGYTTLSVVSSSPAVVDGKVYVGSWSGRIYCLNASNAAYIWSYTAGGSVQSSPAVVDGRVYVGSSDRRVYCLDASTGSHIWNYTTGAEVNSSPAVVDGKVCVGSWDGKIYCLNATNGACVWSYATGSWVHSSPAVAEGRVYIGSGDGKVYAFGSAAPPPTYALTITATLGGTTSPAAGTYTYSAGTVVSVTATPNTGYTFDRWELDGINNSTNPINVTINADHTLHAVFATTTDWWTMFHHDQAHTGYSTSTAPNTNSTIWSYTTGGAVFSSPAVANGKVYFGSYDYRVYCLDALTGSHIWNYTTGDFVFSSPAVANGRVYVGSDNGRIYCLDALTGSHIWNYTTGNDVLSSPAIADGKVYFGSFDGNVYCLNASTGAYIWGYTTLSVVSSSPTVVDGRVHVGSHDGNVYCLDASTGAFIWSYTTGDAVQSSPAVADGKIYVGSFDDRVYCLDALSGAFIWSYTTGFDVFSSPAVANGRVYVGSDNGRIYCLDALTGNLIWSYATSFWVFSSLAVVDGKVYVGSGNGRVYAFGRAHNVATTDATLSKTAVGQGYSANVSVTVANQGSYPETFNVTLYAYSGLAINETGLVGYWKFDEGSGTTAYDSSGNNNHGTIYGATWANGKYGNALQFDGIDDYVEIPFSSSLTLKNWTLMAFCKPRSSQVYWSRLISVGVIENSINLGVNNWYTWGPFGEFQDSFDNSQFVFSPDPFQPEEWQMVTFTYDGSTMGLYKNDMLIATASVAATVKDYSTPIRIGARMLPDEFFNGIIDEVKIFDRALSADEVWAEYTRTRERFAIQTRSVTLEAGSSATVTFTWNTTGFAKGNYTISAYASPVQGETDTEDNLLTDGSVKIGIPGDINGDTVVDSTDLGILGSAWGSFRGDPNYVPEADINDDGVIDSSDLGIMGAHWGETE